MDDEYLQMLFIHLFLSPYIFSSVLLDSELHQLFNDESSLYDLDKCADYNV